MLATLTQFLLHHLADHPDQEDLTMILADLATIGKTISKETNRAGIAGVRGEHDGGSNIQGEVVQKLDVFANELCKRVLTDSDRISAMASEEEDTIVELGEDGESARYVIAFDPLDGSSNIDVNVSIGTIFSLHERIVDIPRNDERQFFQMGKNQVLAGYFLYGSSTVFVFSVGNGVHEFTLEPDTGEFFLSNEHITVPDVCVYYSVNEAYAPYVSSKDNAYLAKVKSEFPVTARHIGSLVADFHRNLLKGGVHMSFLRDNGDGEWKAKLRLNYELKPLAYLLAQAGGQATDGKQDILDIVPTTLHQRCPVIMGNSAPVELYRSLQI